MVHKGCAEEVILMEKTKVTIESVRVYDEQEYPIVQLFIKEKIKGYIQNGNTFDQGDVDHISINRSQLTKDLCSCNDLIAEYRGCRVNAFDQKAFHLILWKSVLTIVRTPHSAGEIVKDADGNNVTDSNGDPILYNRDCFTTTIVGVSLTPEAQKKLDRACSLD